MIMKLLVFDNYDSFTYNIMHALRDLGVNPDVVRNDRITPEECAAYDKIVISPGPGIPSEAGVLLPMIKHCSSLPSPIPMLGVCLGHQAIAESFGGSLYNLPEVYHGISTPADIIADSPLFNGLGKKVDVGRYHSWAVDKESLPDCLEVTAVDSEGIIMALQHKVLPVYGVQFHPESILTPQGMTIIENWLKL